MSQIYLISPPQIELKSFSKRLDKSLKTGLTPVFQLRLKNYSDLEVLKISQELKKICRDNDVLFLLNDYHKIALDVEAGGVHMGVDDGSIAAVRRQVPENFIIGASCYDSRHLAMEAGEQGANYLSFGAFFNSKTKKSRGNPSPEILSWCDEIINLPSVAIGGITDKNCRTLVAAGADFLSVISYIWDNEDGEILALERLSDEIKKCQN